MSRLNRIPWARSLLAVCVVALLGIVSFRAWQSRAPRGAPALPAVLAPRAATAPSAEYAGSEACRACHAAEFAAWQTSHHGLAERPFERPHDAAALDQALAASSTDGHAVRWIGVSPLEQPLIELPNGRVQALDLAQDPARREWFSIFGRDQRKPGDWGHWTGRGMNWNASCAYCHNTALKKNYESSSDSYHTTFAERAVGCESCHGPLSAHVAAPTQAVPRSTPRQTQDACGVCHALRAELTDTFRPGDPFDDHFSLEIPGIAGTFYADGEVRDEAYELTAFMGSRMAHAGVSCTDCHDSHSAKLRAADDSLCLRCHATGERNSPRIDAREHSFHEAGTPGAACVNCHMPETTYMQRHARRDHGFTIPDPQLTIEHAVPNACTRCHTSKPATWALAALQRHYGQGSPRARRAHRRSDLVARGRDRDPAAQSALIAQLEHDAIPLWRAVAAGLLQQYLDNPEVLAALLRATRDTDSLVRSSVLRALEGARNPRNTELEAALKVALADSARSVRVAAAWDLRRDLEEDSLAGRDLQRFLALAADQPLGQAQLAEYALARGRLEAGIEHLERAAQWDGASARLRHELAVALSQAGRNQEAVSALREAVRLNPKQPEYAQALGLALNEAGDLPAAIRALERAVALDPSFARAWYNLALARDHAGDPEAARAALSHAEQLSPDDPDIQRARSTLRGR